MLNEDLLDPKDLEIAKLKQTIAHFKEYDEKRKKYYSDALQRLGEYESYFQEREDTDPLVQKLQKKVDAYRPIVIKYEKLIANQKVPDDIKSMDRVDIENKLYTLQWKYNDLNTKYKSLSKTNNDLIYKLVQLKKKYENNNDSNS